MNIHALLATQTPQGQSTAPGQGSAAVDTQSGGFLQALGQASLSGSEHITRSRPTGEGQRDTGTSLQQITQQLKALGLSDAQLQNADMQALIEQIQQQPEMAQALQTLVMSLEQNTGTLPPLADSTGSETPADTSALKDIAQRMDLLAAFGDSTATDTEAAQWRQALTDLLQGEDSPAEPLAGLLTAMVQAPTNASPLSTGTGGETPPANALRNALLAAQTSTQANSAQTSTQANSAQPDAGNSTAARPAADGAAMLNIATTTPANINVSASPISGDALLAALNTANAESQQSMQPFTGSLTQSLAGSSTNALAGAAPAQASVTAPLTSAAWPQQLGQQLAQFTQRSGEQQIKLQIHPAELGPLSISLKVSEHGGTQAQFLSSHAQVRQVVEQAIPQLREALAEQGISLGDTSVGEQNQGQQAFSESGQPGQGSGAGGDIVDSGSIEPSISPRMLAVDGRVDLYA